MAQIGKLQRLTCLGAHLNYGRGCAACHAPHSGACGNGISNIGDPTTGNIALWGQDVGLWSARPSTSAAPVPGTITRRPCVWILPLPVA